MTRILVVLAFPVIATLFASCCCTSDIKPRGLRPLPQFQEIPSAPDSAPVIYGTK